MMRLFFFLLILANVLLMLVFQSARQTGTEPERLAQQIHPERVNIIAQTSPSATAAITATPATTAPATATAANTTTTTNPATPAKPAVSPATAATSATTTLATAAAAPAAQTPVTSGTKAVTGKCTELGEFNTQTAEKFESRLAQLALPVLPQKRLVLAPPSHIVYLPSQASEQAALRRLAKLREQGFDDVSVIRDHSVRRWGLSIGVFSNLQLAQARLAAIKAQGITDARIEEYPLNASRFAYRLNGLDASGREKLGKLATEFTGIRLTDCP